MRSSFRDFSLDEEVNTRLVDALFAFQIALIRYVKKHLLEIAKMVLKGLVN